METINKQPISDPLVVLDLLVGVWGDGTVRWLHVGQRMDDPDHPHHIPAHVEVMHFHARGDHSGSDYYSVALLTLSDLKAAGHIRGKPEWGYTSARKYRATEEGAAFFQYALEKVSTKGEREMRSARWLREVKPIPWAVPASLGHGKYRATWQTEDYP